MGENIQKIIFNCLSVLYPLIFIFNFYVITFTHMKNIKEDKTYLIVFFFSNLVSFYIICIYFKLWLDSGKSRIHNKYRNLDELFLDGIDNHFHEAFINEEMILHNNSIIVCEKCDVYKPPRAHHCSICNCCYLKMDHHCALLNICIGHRNYKSFYLFILSNSVFSIGKSIIIMIEIFFRIYPGIPRPIYIVSGVLAIIQMFIFLSLLIFHTNLLLRNETTIEWLSINCHLEGRYIEKKAFQEGPLAMFQTKYIKDRKILNPYNLGWYENFIEVFGKRKLFWFIPNFTGLSDGFHFRKNF